VLVAHAAHAATSTFFWATEGFSPAPDCFEVIANSILWDPFGMQWGCDGHWPLLLAYGTKRYRSEGNAAAAR
jgi:hypothetical protein